MSFRSRVAAASLVGVLLPLVVVGLGVRGTVERRLESQYRTRVEALASVIQVDLERRGEEVERRLAALGRALASDNRFRAAVGGGGADRGYLLDYAGQAMRLAGLDMLQIQDSAGRIVSSGHFRNAFDVVSPALPRRLAALPAGPALARVRTAEGDFLALVRIDSVRLGAGSYTLVGGTRVDRAFLAGLSRDPELSVRLRGAGPLTEGGSDTGADRSAAPPSGSLARSVAFPYVDPGAGDSGTPSSREARFEITYDGATLRSLTRSVDLWLVLVLAGAVALALGTSAWLSARVTRPLEALAARTSRVDLDRLDVDFTAERDDEIGQLARVLGRMTERLRAGARELRDAERRATLGEVARQVNHDVRNGLVPIRNVLAHLDRVAADEPEELRRVFGERRESLAASVAYLETLAGNYARLSTRAGEGSADPRSVVSVVVEGISAAGGARVRADVPAVLPRTRGSPVTLRRIVENLVTNAVDAAGEAGGSVAVSVTDAGPDGVRFVVEDTGPGMTEEVRRRAFEDFFTTKEGGTGLGLPLVRRLVRDLGGRVELESGEGRGTRVTVLIPAADGGPTPASNGEDGEVEG